MFTRCPKCESVHALSAALLALANGRVRCGNCNHAYPALSALFDDWPKSSAAPASSEKGSAPPVLGSHPEIEDRSETDDLPEIEDQSRTTWIVVLVLLALATVANLAWTFRAELARDPLIREMLVSAGMMEREEAPVYRDLSMIHLVSRDLHKHPTLAGMLSMSAIFVNRGPRAQPFPDIELKLVDAGNAVVAGRTFIPEEYLAAGIDPADGMSAGVHVTILLEFVDPGSAATGFEIEFR